MKILVAVKRVIDSNVRVRVKSDHTGIETANVKMSMNPFDEVAVEQAVRLRESGIADEIVIVSIGTKATADTIRTALALGGDRGILVQSEAVLEPLMVAHMLKTLAEKEAPGLILLGKQAIDDDAAQTGPMLAALLGWPQGTFASELTVTDASASSITVVREVDGGLETLALQLPAVVTVDLRLNEPRFASLPNIMKAKKKPIETLTPEDLGPVRLPRVITLKVEEPPERPRGIMVASVSELIHKLKNEAKVIS